MDDEDQVQTPDGQDPKAAANLSISKAWRALGRGEDARALVHATLAIAQALLVDDNLDYGWDVEE